MEVFWKGQTAAQMLYSTHFMHQPTQQSQSSLTAPSPTAVLAAAATTSNSQTNPPNSNLNVTQYVTGTIPGGAPNNVIGTTNHLEQVVAATVAPPQNLACALCPKTFDNQLQLSEHLRSHATGAKKPYTCQECGKSFLQSNNLQTHMK